jgi:hypothetical protein
MLYKQKTKRFSVKIMNTYVNAYDIYLAAQLVNGFIIEPQSPFEDLFAIFGPERTGTPARKILARLIKNPQSGIGDGFERTMDFLIWAKTKCVLSHFEACRQRTDAELLFVGLPIVEYCHKLWRILLKACSEMELKKEAETVDALVSLQFLKVDIFSKVDIF